MADLEIQEPDGMWERSFCHALELMYSWSQSAKRKKRYKKHNRQKVTDLPMGAMHHTWNHKSCLRMQIQVGRVKINLGNYPMSREGKKRAEKIRKRAEELRAAGASLDEIRALRTTVER